VGLMLALGEPTLKGEAIRSHRDAWDARVRRANGFGILILTTRLSRADEVTR
jgi:hypothetical protein